MSRIYLLFGMSYLACILLMMPLEQLFAYVVIPRNVDDTTERMNAGGDRANRPGLRDAQRSPEYLDDRWGVNDYYYSDHGIYETRTIRNPSYSSNNPPYYPLPNVDYDRNHYRDQYRNYNYYRPGYAR